MPMFAHNVKAESKAETISSDTNDLSQYKKINGISSQTVLGADFSHYQLQKNAWKKVWKNYKGIVLIPCDLTYSNTLETSIPL